MSLIDYRLAWARNYLKNIGLIASSQRGVWSITEAGEHVAEPEILQMVRDWKSQYNRSRYAERKAAAESEGSGDIGDATGEDEPFVEDEPQDWKETLLTTLMGMHPAAFERLAQRLLREAGFRNVEVLGRSGDGGLDGIGVYRLSLVSFPVFFQCKRYQGSVGPHHVRDFRGAMSGRGEKGLLITTGTFSKDAKAEATRDGAPPVELIDGDNLCELLKEFELGVATRLVEEVTVSVDFFADV
jgi:restriction system protein